MIAGKFYRYVSGKNLWAPEMAPAADGRTFKAVKSTDPRLRDCPGLLLEGIETNGPAYWFGIWEEMKEENGAFVPAGKWTIWSSSLRKLNLPTMITESAILPVTCAGCTETATEAGPDGLSYCKDCMDQKWPVCRGCGKRHPVATLQKGYCPECFAKVKLCPECGRNEIYGEEEVCKSCLDSYQDRVVRSYHSRPTLVKHSTDALLMGVETEACYTKTTKIGEYKILKAMRTADPHEMHYYFNSDGSIGRGFEWITQPHNLAQYMSDKLPWKKHLDMMREHGMRSHDTDCCGLHIHVSRAPFNSQTVANLVSLYENNYPDMVHFSRRSAAELSWCSRHGVRMGEAPAKKGQYTIEDRERRRAINLTNTNTIEFRLFKGTLNYQTWLACLQLVYSMCHIALSPSKDSDLYTFDEIIHFSGFPEIKEYWEKRKSQKRERLEEGA